MLELINAIWILNQDGICLAQRNYTHKEIDPALFSGLISAIQLFSKSVTEREIESFQMKDQKVLYDVSDIVLAINFDVEDNEVEIKRKMKEVKEKFTNKYDHEIKNMSIDAINTDIFEEFEKDFDLILYNDWNFEYDRKIRGKKTN
ncbi:MAG: hypothetical protein EAX96_03335 [Candidatus Lokiarchaeota archaeon]|nr:hypothetical protein [Candidatus Lokiarchaeota archaeon]